MKTSAIALFVVAALASVVDADVPANFPQLMLTAVNAERAKMNLAPLCTNAKLQKAAQLHSEDQATNNFMSHTGTGGSTMQTRIDAQKFKWNSIAENVAAGQADVAAVMKSWMNSPGHKANILGKYKFFGTGYALNAKATWQHYWTQNFATGGSEVCDGAPREAGAITPNVTAVVPTSTPTTVAPNPVPATVAPSLAPFASAPKTVPAAVRAAEPTLQQRMLAAVNTERAKACKAALCTNAKLQRAAQLHSEDQAAKNFMGHTGSSGSTMASRIDGQKFKWNGIAENVAVSQPDVDAVMKSWMNSPGHKANILGDYKFFGMGYAFNAKASWQHYWTQDFAKSTGETCEP